MMMTYNIERHDDLHASVLHLQGDIDIAVVPELRTALESLVDTGITNVVVDLSKVAYADSSALGLLVWLDSRLRDHEGRIVISGPNGDVARILEISGLLTIAPTLSSSQSVEDALDGFESLRREARFLWSRNIDMAPDVEQLGKVREEVVESIAPMQFTEAALFDIKVALGEALANAVRHGSSEVEQPVGITVEAYDDRVMLKISDSGCGFDGEHSCSEDLYASGGRGIMFMRALMDQVEFSPSPEGGTVVTLVKHRVAADQD